MFKYPLHLCFHQSPRKRYFMSSYPAFETEKYEWGEMTLKVLESIKYFSIYPGNLNVFYIQQLSNTGWTFL